ncbi:Sporulation integral membrane protein YtvI [Candidatus Hydrogenisulfobacillus filiaventi]|uniref:Sporulation integral membrane protein YtvI n=1 Tax=Candidatus Hydrogenisulfobacillus filiaventi TaxID=2707344 RepID=A0A6F8ZFV4_9FIRM|nr:sporulation integral membrane protein YtvI [Bacillota bacterium]CAB1128761.1 Sporulation integral membrane protein YtvI [Candidatus Hydrogenisulfobacillus filiaventi]
MGGAEGREYLRAVLIWLALLAGTYVFWRWLVGFVLPFVVAVVVALAVEPLAARWERHLSPGLASLAALVTGVGGTLAVAGLLVGAVVTELLQLAHEIPHYLRQVEHALLHTVARLGQLRQAIPVNPSLLSGQLASVAKVAEGVVRDVLNLAAHLPDFLLMLLVAIIAAFFVLRDRRLIGRLVQASVPPALRPRLPALRLDMAMGFFGFVKAQLLLMLITAITTTLGLFLAGSRYAILLGLVAGLLDLVPYMGPTGLLLPWTVILFLTGHTLGGVKIAAVMTGVAMVRQLVEPRLVGGTTGLHPLTALFALYVGIKVFGPVGFLIGPVSAVILKALARALDVLPGSG